MEPLDVAGSLPEPRDSDPPQLRGDIVDELSDHLQCALRRELLADSNPDRASQRVLEKFGDPSVVARELWWGEMRGRIMTQKIVMAVLCVLVVATLGMSFLMWQSMVTTRDMNRELLAEIRAFAAKPSPAPTPVPVPSDWSPLKLKLVLEGPEKKPAEGVFVDLYEGMGDGQKKYVLSRKSTAEGIADFGQIRHGQYEIQVRTPEDASINLALFLRPGEPPPSVIICPKQRPLFEAEIALEIDTEQAHSLAGIESLDYFITLLADKHMEVAHRSWTISRPNYGFQVHVDSMGKVKVALPDLPAGGKSKIVDGGKFTFETSDTPFRVAQVDFAQTGGDESSSKDNPSSHRFRIINRRATNAGNMSRFSPYVGNTEQFVGVFDDAIAQFRQQLRQSDLRITDDSLMVAKSGEQNTWRIPLFKNFVIPALKQESESRKLIVTGDAKVAVSIGQVDRRMLLYYENVVKKYDTNKDGVLTKDEWATMSKDPSKHDADGDGRITALEMAAGDFKGR